MAKLPGIAEATVSAITVEHADVTANKEIGADPNRCEAHHISPWNRGGPVTHRAVA